MKGQAVIETTISIGLVLLAILGTIQLGLGVGNVIWHRYALFADTRRNIVYDRPSWGLGTMLLAGVETGFVGFPQFSQDGKDLSVKLTAGVRAKPAVRMIPTPRMRWIEAEYRLRSEKEGIYP